MIALSHPNTIQFFDFGEMDDGTLFIVMEYIKGESLAHVLLRGPIEPSRVDRLMIQSAARWPKRTKWGSCIATSARERSTHQCGWPSRLRQSARFWHREAERRGERTRHAAHTTGHGARHATIHEPRAVQRHAARCAFPTSTRLASIAYEMLVGELPFEARTPWEWATKHLTETPSDLGQNPIAKGLHPNKVSAVMRALHKDREQRFENVTEFLRRLSASKTRNRPGRSATSTTTGNVLHGSTPNPQPLPNPVGTANTPRGLVTGEQFSIAGLPQRRVPDAGPCSL